MHQADRLDHAPIGFCPARAQLLRPSPRDPPANQTDLKIVVVVPKFPDEDGRFSGPPNRVAQIAALRELREFGEHRFAVYDLDRDRLPIPVHAKICIIDDVWMTVGSDNFNRRSWTHDSELSCAVPDSTLDVQRPEDPGGLGDGARLLPRATRPTGRLRMHSPQPVGPFEAVPARLLYRLVNDPDGRPIRKRISRTC
jgi:hypothetical protein